MSMQIGDERTPYFLDLISRLDETQRDILTSLRDRGPGLAMDIAVRVLRFPDEIGRPLRTLQAMNLVRARPFTGGQMGAELFSLTPEGEQVVRLLRNPDFMRALTNLPVEPAAAAATLTPAFDPHQEEIALLRRLGDLAAKRGDDQSAADYYNQALEKTRHLTAAS